MKTHTVNIGDRWVDVVRNSATDRELSEVYRTGLPILADLLNKFASQNRLRSISLADFGGAVGDITKHLRENVDVEMSVTCFDADEALLAQNESADNKIVTDLAELSAKEKYDVGVMRYVLNYNSLKDQQKILENTYQALKDQSAFLNWWCGVADQVHQKKFQTLFTTKEITSKLLRPNAHWTTWEENQELFGRAGFKVKVEKEFSVPVRNLYKVRYNLSDEENKEILDFLGDYSFISYVIFSATK